MVMKVFNTFVDKNYIFSDNMSIGYTDIQLIRWLEKAVDKWQNVVVKT